MDKIQAVIDSVEQSIEDSPNSQATKLLDIAAEKSGIPRATVAVGVSALFLAIIPFCLGMHFLTDVFAVAYPSFMSFKAIKSKTKSDDTRWLVYWVVFGLLNLLEHISDIILFWLPFYYELKIMLLLWCMYPVDQNGSIVLWEKVFEPFFIKHAEELEDRFSKVTNSAQDTNDAIDETKKTVSFTPSGQKIA